MGRKKSGRPRLPPKQPSPEPPTLPSAVDRENSPDLSGSADIQDSKVGPVLTTPIPELIPSSTSEGHEFDTLEMVKVVKRLNGCVSLVSLLQKVSSERVKHIKIGIDLTQQLKNIWPELLEAAESVAERFDSVISQTTPDKSVSEADIENLRNDLRNKRKRWREIVTEYDPDNPSTQFLPLAEYHRRLEAVENWEDEIEKLSQTAEDVKAQLQAIKNLESNRNDGTLQRKTSSKKPSTLEDQRADRVRLYYKSNMSLDEKQGLAKSRIEDLKEYFRSFRKDSRYLNLFLEAVEYAKEKKRWKSYICHHCDLQYTDFGMNLLHLFGKHLEDISPDLQSVYPDRPSEDMIQELTEAVWSPETLIRGKCKTPQLQEIAKMIEARKKVEFKNHTTRKKFVKEIHENLMLLHDHKFLSADLLHKMVADTVQVLEEKHPELETMNHKLDETLLCLTLLDVLDLAKIKTFMTMIAEYCNFAWVAQNDCLLEKDEDEKRGSLILKFHVTGRIVFSCDQSSLLLENKFLTGKLVLGSCDAKTIDDNSAKLVPGLDDTAIDASQSTAHFLDWMLSIPQIPEYLQSWLSVMKYRKKKGLEKLNSYAKEIEILREQCTVKRDCVLLRDAFEVVADICLEDMFNSESREEFQPITEKVNSYLVGIRKFDAGLVSKGLDMFGEILKEAERDLKGGGEDGDGESVDSEEDLKGGSEVDKEETEENEMTVDKEELVHKGVKVRDNEMTVEINKCDARIMRSLAVISHLERKLELLSEKDYRSLMVMLLKSFIRANLEKIVEKDAEEKADAAREALLAELELEENKKAAESTTTKTSRKLKKKKNKSRAKAKTFKEPTCDEEQSPLLEDNVEEDPDSATNAGDSSERADEFEKVDEVETNVEEQERKLEEGLEKVDEEEIDFEDQERKLEEGLEMQREFETQLKDSWHSMINKKRASEEETRSGDLCRIEKRLKEVLGIPSEYENQAKESPPSEIDDEYLPSDIYDISDDWSNWNNFSSCLTVGASAGEAEAKPSSSDENLTKQIQSRFKTGQDSVQLEKDRVSEHKNVIGTGLRNDFGDFNCFLNVIIQSLWNLREFREKFINLAPALPSHAGNPCVVCALHTVFIKLEKASRDMSGEIVDPSPLRIALSLLKPNSNFFQEGQMNDASEVLGEIFDCLHIASVPIVSDSDLKSQQDPPKGFAECSREFCLSHQFFGMEILERMDCKKCGVMSREMKYTAFFVNINAYELRELKILNEDKTFSQIVKIIQMDEEMHCDPDKGGCNELNHKNLHLSSQPLVYTIILSWKTTNESSEDISKTVAALATEIDIDLFHEDSIEQNKFSLVSIVCYYGLHYICFARNSELGNWILYNDSKVESVRGRTSDSGVNGAGISLKFSFSRLTRKMIRS